MTSTDAAKIAQLNDAFRKHPHSFLDWVITTGVHALGQDFVSDAIKAVENFDSFTPDNDPHGEHDFGSFELDGKKLFWKIDYYDRNLEFGSEDPASSERTRRVMTIMLAEEY